MTKSIKKICLIIVATLAVLAFAFSLVGYGSVNAAVDTNGALTFENKAEVRLDDKTTDGKDETGMRFYLQVDKDKLSQITSEYDGYDVSYGVAMIPAEYVTGEFDATATYGVETLHIPLLVGKTEGNVITFKAVLTDIPSVHYDTEIAARGYVKLTKAGEDDVYIQSQSAAKKAIGEVATAFYNDKDVITPEEEVLYKKLLEEKVTNLYFDKEDYYIFMNERTGENYTTEYKLYGNKYGFMLDADFITAKGVTIDTGVDTVATAANGSITATGKGDTTITATMGGKTATANVKVENVTDLAAALGTNEIASFDHKGYETMVTGTANNSYTDVRVGDFHGKKGVIEISGETAGGPSFVRIDVPGAIPAGQRVTIQIYIEFGSVAGGGTLGLSGASTGLTWSGGSPTGYLPKGQWENVVLTAPNLDALYLALSVQGVSFKYYISTIMSGDQNKALLSADAMAYAENTTLAADEVASFDNDGYLDFVNVYGVFNGLQTEITEHDGKTGVLHIGGTTMGFSKIYIGLPRTVNKNLTMEYQMFIDPADDSVNAWAIMTAGEGWGALKPATSVTEWSNYATAEYNGSNCFVIGFNQAKSFDLYISSVKHDPDKTALRAEYKDQLAAALTGDLVADFSTGEYLYFVEHSGFSSFSAEIIDDELDTNATPRKVLHISGSAGFQKIYLILPKTITDPVYTTIEYRITGTQTYPDNPVNGWAVMYPGASMGVGETWDLGLKDAVNVTEWTRWAFGCYSGKDYITIGINNFTSFDLYIAAVYSGNHA